ncbi:MAG: CvpA family protein [Desulfobulbaceae bacterium]|nr:CvpA family protein [Desulfobulbaceae bacterium]HIJ78367.1 CvpA family protein [Deltaproteobacteria bacterium]
MTYTYLDGIFIVIILIFLIRGIWVGLIRQLASIMALALGFIIAGSYYEQFSPQLNNLIDSPRISFLVTYAVIFLAVFITIMALGFLLKKVVTISLLGWFDRLLGGIFGLAKAIIISTIFFMVLSGIMAGSNPVLTKSFFTPYLTKSSGFFLVFIKNQELHPYFIPQKPAISLPDLLLLIPDSKTKG